jgi:hypothetical protein
MVIQPCNCVIQYDGNLKTERYDFVQVVLLMSLIWIYQDSFFEEVQKYGNREISEGSLVSCCSKDDMAGWWATTFIIRKPKNLLLWLTTNKKEKCSSVVGNRWLLSNETFIAVEGPKPDTIFKKVL